MQIVDISRTGYGVQIVVLSSRDLTEHDERQLWAIGKQIGVTHNIYDPLSSVDIFGREVQFSFRKINNDRPS